MAKINKEMIARILQHVGGAGNVAQAGNCMTRLRLTLRDESRADSAAIRQIDGVMGVIVSDEQFQVVLGPGKAQSAAEMMNALLEDAPAEAPSLADVAAEKKQALKSKQTSGIQKFLAKFATIFTPLIPGFIAVGLLLGFATLAEQIFVLENAHPNATLLIMGAITFTVIMPIGGWLFTGMSWLFLHLNGNPFGSAVLAGLFLLAVMFGVHQGFVPVYFALVDAQGFNSLFPILAMAGAGQVGAALALFWRAKHGSLLRTQIKGAIIPGFLGIGEPLIYGVTLPRMKPFITACLGGACGGFFLGLIAWMGLPVGLNTVFGPSGLVALPLMTSGSGIYAGMAVYAAGLAVSYLCGFALTWLFGSKNVDLS
ncbi:hypothetical protein HMPREF2540_11505 [Enterobacter sp. HMSC055A11]|nr:hypothetical protein HMPREF2540_11505 [Enterobacter sp. HMSC055A11]